MLLKGLFLTGLLLIFSEAKWLLETNMEVITPGSSQQVELICRYTNSKSDTDDLSKLYKIRIIKADPFGGKQTFATNVQAKKELSTTANDVKVSAGTDGAFLKVTWSRATENTAGAYKCVILYYTDDTEAQSFETEPIIIKEKRVTRDDVIALIQSETLAYAMAHRELNEELVKVKTLNNLTVEEVKERIEKKVSKMNIFFNDLQNKKQTEIDEHKDILSKMLSIRNFALISPPPVYTETEMRNINRRLTNLEDLVKVLDSRINNVTETLTNKLNNLKCSCPIPDLNTTQVPPTEEVTFPTDSTEWPSGEYSMIKPLSGCPNTKLENGLSMFKEISSDIHMKPEDKSYDHGAQYYFKSTIHERNARCMLTFCGKREMQNSTDKPWPKGSYCIAISNGTCPDTMQLEELKFTTLTNTTTLHVFISEFCCRDDGSASSPVKLPTAKPFYLIRHGNICQSVEGTTVRDDTLHFEVNNGIRLHTFYARSHQDKKHHADLTDRPFRHLCYYQRK